MSMKKMSSERSGMLKGAFVTAVVFSAGIGAGLFFLKRKHEADLDKLERDTARNCLDVAAEHYEKVLRRKKKEEAAAAEAAPKSAHDEPLYDEFLEFQRNLEAAEEGTHSEDEWKELEKQYEAQKMELERMMAQTEKRSALLNTEFERVKLKLLHIKAKELADRALEQRSKTPDAVAVESGQESNSTDRCDHIEV